MAGKAKKSSGESNGNGTGVVERWIVQMPGGPRKLIRSNKKLTENKVKEIYLSQLKFVRARQLEDPDLRWPGLTRVTEDDVEKHFKYLLQESKRQNHRGTIDVVDGDVVEDRKDPVERPRESVRVETTIGKK